MAGRSQEALYAEIDLELSWSERRAATGGADEARPPAAPISRQVHSAARRGVPAPLLRTRASASTTPSSARARRSSRRTCSAPTRSAATSPPSTACCRGSRPRGTRSRRSSCRFAGDAGGRTPTGGRRTRPARVRGCESGSRRGRSGSCSRIARSPGRRPKATPATSAVILSRAARSARMTTHFDLDFPRAPAREPYHCHKHKRDVPTGGGGGRSFSSATRATPSAGSARSRPFRRIDGPTCSTPIREPSSSGSRPDGVITSPPYPGLIDYHEQHRYAYELLGLEDRASGGDRRCGGGNEQAGIRRYVEAHDRGVQANTASSWRRRHRS